MLSESGLSRKELQKRFGIKLPPELTDKEREECQDINRLFDALRDHGYSEKDVFISAYRRKGDALRYLSRFLHNVRSCTPKVRTHAQKLLRGPKKASRY